jgi:hypothetical protein
MKFDADHRYPLTVGNTRRVSVARSRSCSRSSATASGTSSTVRRAACVFPRCDEEPFLVEVELAVVEVEQLRLTHPGDAGDEHEPADA